MSKPEILINRAPVLTLWAAVVAERLGYDRDCALTLGRAIAGASAQAKAKALGLVQPSAEPKKEAKREPVAGERVAVELFGRIVTCVHTKDGLRALDKDRPATPDSVRRYVEKAFGPNLDAARTTMVELAASMPPAALRVHAFKLYEAFRPTVPPGERGWGAKGVLDLEQVVAAGRR